MFPPALPPGGWSDLVGATLDTVAMALLAMDARRGPHPRRGPFGTRMRPTASGQLGPAVLAAHVDTATPPWWRAPRLAERFAAHALLLVLRSGPPTVWAVIALLAMFPGILPGVIALGLYTAGILGRFVAEAWESVDTRPRDALRAHGVRPATASLAGPRRRRQAGAASRRTTRHRAA